MTAKRIAAALAALALGACSSSKVVALVEGRAGEICRCADLRCVADVVVKFQKELERYKDPKGSEADQKRIDAAVAREAACIERLRLASSTGNAPTPGETPPAEK